MGGAFALFLTSIITAILLLNVIFIIGGCITLILGVIAKVFLYNKRLNILANITLIAGFSLLWLGLLGMYPGVMVVICFAFGFTLIAKNNEFYLLKWYWPAIFITLFIGFPFFTEAFAYVQLALMFLWCLACLIGFGYLLFKKKCVKEGYSFILLSEGTIALLWLVFQYFVNNMS